MKNTFLLLLLGIFTINIVACGGDDEDPIGNDDGTDSTKTKVDPLPGNVDDIATDLGGPGGVSDDSVIFKGSQLFRAYWNGLIDEYDPEQDFTDNATVLFKLRKIWFKYDNYQSPRVGMPVGKGRIIDEMGYTSFNWELHPGTNDSLFVNQNESYPPRGSKQEWVLKRLRNDTLEYSRDWTAGGTKYRDRMIWVKE